MSNEESEDPGSLELEARYKMYTKIQQYQDNLVFPSLPLGSSDSASSSSSSSSSSYSYATSFSSRRSISAAAASAAAVAVKVKEQSNNASVTSLSLSIEAQNVLRSLLQKDPLLRMSAKNILLSDWLCES